MMFLSNLMGKILLCAAFFLACPLYEVQASPDPQFSSDVLVKVGKKPASVYGTASAGGGRSRLDITTHNAGMFFLVVDAENKTMRVASERLKAYVEVPVAGDPQNWRDLLKSAAAVIAPQSLGMINIQESERKSRGRSILNGYSAERSSSVFDVTFMGRQQRFKVNVWENRFFAPFPMQVAVAETKDTWPGKASLVHVTADDHDPEYFEIPDGYTRYASVMELVLYALAHFSPAMDASALPA